MNTNTALVSDQKGNRKKREITDISSMLLPLQGVSLLLPGVAVAEIVTFVPPEPDSDDETPTWFLGNIFWRNQRVPLISLETMTEGKFPLMSSHCRIAVMNNTGLNPQLNFFGVLLQATPRLLRLTSEELVINNEKILENGEKMHVLVAGEEAVIPDMRFFEHAIIQYLQLS